MATTAAANPSFVPQSPSHWVADEKRNSCKSCHKEFTLFFRRHHCRSCREVFCGDCSDFRLLTRDPKDPTVVISVRACRSCFEKFRGRKMRGPKANSGTAAASPAIAKARRNSRAAEAEKPHVQHHVDTEQTTHAKREVEMEPADQDGSTAAVGEVGAVKGSEDILHIPSDSLASVKNSTVQHIDPQQHHHYEGEDADITGTETIRVEEDEDHTVYGENGPEAHTEEGHTIKLFTVLGADGKAVDVDRDVVMATQGSVVLPSKTAEGGLQFVNVDNTHSANRPSAKVHQHTGPATATTTATADLPSDTQAVFQKSHVTARTPSNATASTTTSMSTSSSTSNSNSNSNSTTNSNIVFLPVDKEKLVVTSVTGGEKDEFDRSSGGAVEGSEEIMNIPSDALASVKNSTLMARQHQMGQEEGEVAWSERNVENRFAAASPTNAVPMLFNEGEQQSQEEQSSASRPVV